MATAFDKSWIDAILTTSECKMALWTHRTVGFPEASLQIRKIIITYSGTLKWVFILLEYWPHSEIGIEDDKVCVNGVCKYITKVIEHPACQ